MTIRMRAAGQKHVSESTGGRRARGGRPATVGMLAVLLALGWAAPAQPGSGPIPVAVPASVRAPLAPSQDDPGVPAIPEPVAPDPGTATAPDAGTVAQPDPVAAVQPDPATAAQPDPVPVTQPDPVAATQPDPAAATQPDPAALTQPAPATAVQPDPAAIIPQAPASGATPLFPSELATPGVPSAGPAVAVPDSGPSPLAPVDQPSPFAPAPESPSPLIQAADPAQDPMAATGCPFDAGPGALFPPSVWSVCPGLAPGVVSGSPLASPSQLSGLSGLGDDPSVPGASQIQIPWVTGFPSGDAQSVLSSTGLNIGTVTQEPSSQPAGTVLRTDPPFGSAVEPGRAINLVVAGG